MSEDRFNAAAFKKKTNEKKVKDTGESIICFGLTVLIFGLAGFSLWYEWVKFKFFFNMMF